MAHVQGVSIAGTSSGTTVTFTGIPAIGPGNCIVGIFQFRSATNTVSNLQVGGTNAVLLTGDFLNIVAAHSAIPFYLFNITGGPTTITANFTTTPSGGTDQYLNFDEYSNQNGIQQHASASNNGTATSASAAITTTSPNGQTIWTGLNCPGSSMVFPSGFTARNNDTTNAQRSADQVQTTPGSITPTWTWTGATTFYYSVISLLPACAPGSLSLLGVGCSIGRRASLLAAAAWRGAKAIEKNGVITRRGLILPRR